MYLTVAGQSSSTDIYGAPTTSQWKIDTHMSLGPAWSSAGVLYQGSMECEGSAPNPAWEVIEGGDGGQ